MTDYKRVNTYLPTDIDATFKKVAEKLHREGVKNMFRSGDKPNYSAIILYLLKREIGTLERD